MLFGGITLGPFSPRWSDIDLIVRVDADQVTPELADRAGRLWQHLAERPLGDLIYLHVAPCTVLGGPLSVAGGGVTGRPASLRMYRHKTRRMEGYPLSLPDTVNLRRHGAVLAGRDLRPGLPDVPEDWPVVRRCGARVPDHGAAQPSCSHVAALCAGCSEPALFRFRHPSPRLAFPTATLSRRRDPWVRHPAGLRLCATRLRPMRPVPDLGTAAFSLRVWRSRKPPARSAGQEDPAFEYA